MIEAKHWSEVPEEEWRWPNFAPKEMACRGSGAIKIDPALMDALEEMRSRLGKPMIVTSGYRSPAHNRRVGGAKNSQHMYGRAADIMMSNHDPNRFKAVADDMGFAGIGTYPDRNFVHLDVRKSGVARWGDPFPNEAQAFTPEPPERPVRKAVKEGGVTVGGVAALHEGAQQVMAQTAPFLPSEWLTPAALGVAALGLIVVAVRAFKQGDD